ncbi:MBL fold metallo-hydrolase [Phytoactinopolyspora halophila]|nr:MBL fold metallo-hydrolase [Phytoactinopolyspora halophila]
MAPGVSVAARLPGGWFRNNTGWVTGSSGTVMVDTAATEHLTRRLIDQIGIDSAELRIVLTHAHGDHVNGAGLLARRGASVYAAEAACADVRAGPHTFPSVFDAPDGMWGAIDPPERIEPVSERTMFDLGDRRVMVVPVPETAHTPGDLVVYDDVSGTLFAGDLVFSGVTPFALQGRITGWLRALDWLDSFDAARVVPGHGPVPADAAVLTGMREYFHWLLEVTTEETCDFGALTERARQRWAGWHDQERHPVNLRVAYSENHGTDLDLAEGIGAMLHAAGGPIRLDLNTAGDAAL